MPAQVPTRQNGDWDPCGVGSSGVVVRAVNTMDGSYSALKIIPVTLRVEECMSVLSQLVEL